MSLQSIQLCHIDRSPCAENPQRCTVTVHDEGGNMFAEFECTSESEGLMLRNAIREYALKLKRVADYRD